MCGVCETFFNLSTLLSYRFGVLFRTKMYSTTSSSISIASLRPHVKKFVEDNAQVCQPDHIHICDGSEAENQALIDVQIRKGRLVKLSKLDNW